MAFLSSRLHPSRGSYHQRSPFSSKSNPSGERLGYLPLAPHEGSGIIIPSCSITTDPSARVRITSRQSPWWRSGIGRLRPQPPGLHLQQQGVFLVRRQPSSGDGLQDSGDGLALGLALSGGVAEVVAEPWVMG